VEDLSWDRPVAVKDLTLEVNDGEVDPAWPSGCGRVPLRMVAGLEVPMKARPPCDRAVVMIAPTVPSLTNVIWYGVQSYAIWP
jgi:ABC-type Fe3+/spermidine/putrescine transport system ATPase subunit